MAHVPPDPDSLKRRRPLESARPIPRRRGPDRSSLSSARRFAVLALTFVAACTHADSPAPASARGSSGSTPSVAPTDTDHDAIDLLVLQHALAVARDWGHPLELAPPLKARIAPYEGRVQLDVAIEGVDDSVTPQGVETAVATGAIYRATLTGALSATVNVTSGEVGLVRGDVHAAEGTLATVDGRAYRRVGGRWVAESARR